MEDIKNGIIEKDYRKMYFDTLTTIQEITKNCDIKDLKPTLGQLRKYQIKLSEFLKEVTDILTKNNIEYFLDAGTLLGAYRHKGFIPWDDDIDIAMMHPHYENFIKFCKENFIIIDNSKVSYVYKNYTEIRNKYMKKYPNKIILFHFNHCCMLVKGEDFNNHVSLDIFPSDYYDEKYSIEEYKLEVKRINDKIKNIKKMDKILDFIEKQRTSNPNVVKDSNKIYYGFDSLDSTNPDRKHTTFFTKSDIYPLKTIEFEGNIYFANNNIQKKLEIMYGKNFMKYPRNINFGFGFIYRKKVAKNLEKPENYYTEYYNNNKKKYKIKEITAKKVEEYLKCIDVQKQIDELAKEHQNKKIILYGAGEYAKYIINNYDLSKLNIIAICDRTFDTNKALNKTPYAAISTSELPEAEFDEIFTLSQTNNSSMRHFICEKLLSTKYQSKKIYPLILTESNRHIISEDFEYYRSLYENSKKTLEALRCIV